MTSRATWTIRARFLRLASMLTRTWCYRRLWIPSISLMAINPRLRLKQLYVGFAPACCWLGYLRTGSFQRAMCKRFTGRRGSMELKQPMLNLIRLTATTDFLRTPGSWHRSSKHIFRKRNWPGRVQGVDKEKGVRIGPIGRIGPTLSY